MAVVEKEWGERNFGFEFLKSRLNCDMEEEGIVAVCGSAARGAPPPDSPSGRRLADNIEMF